jgi:hypothetical protein
LPIVFYSFPSGTARSTGPGIQTRALRLFWIPGSHLRRAPE